MYSDLVGLGVLRNVVEGFFHQPYRVNRRSLSSLGGIEPSISAKDGTTSVSTEKTARNLSAREFNAVGRPVRMIAG